MIQPRSISGFTLVELLLVMALLAVVMAFSAPSLSRSLRQRNLDEEATRFLALTEYGRNEAVSQGVPMIVWIDPKAQRCGVEPRAGFEGDESRNREFTAHADVKFEVEKVALSRGVIEAIEFGPDGAPATTSVASVRLVDRFESAIAVAKTTDGWSYELVPEKK